jgi:aminoglycoside phosphotransferase (APT) family kinase protein
MDHDALLALARRHPEWWAGADRGSDPEIVLEPLGRGESFTAHLLRRGDRELVLRVPHKSLDELPQSLVAEHDLLRRIPAGLAAAPVDVHEPTAEDPHAYAVTSRVPGRVLPAAAWADETLLAALARSLAHLHHDGDRSGLPVPARPDPVGGAELAHDWWVEKEPEAATALAPLWPAVRRHQELAAPAFAGIEPVLLHGDPAAANLLVDDDGAVRFVDWEWAQVGDPARDLAVIGGQIAAEPWYAALSDAQLRAQTEHYLAARARRGGAGQELRGLPARPEPVLERRRAHLVHEAFFTAAHLHRSGQQERSAALLAQVADVVR